MLAAAGVLALSLTVAGCGGGKNRDVKTGVVGRSTVTEVVEAPATVVAKATSTITAPAEGRITQLLVGDGARVTAGQVLARIDSPQARAQLAQARKADAQAASSGRVSIGTVDFARSQRQSDTAAGQAFATARRAASAIGDPKLRQQALAQVAQATATYLAARADTQATLARFNAGLGSLADALSSLGQTQRLQTRAALAAAQRTMDALEIRAPISGTVSLGTGAGGGGSGADVASLLGQLPAAAQGQASQLLGSAAGAGAGSGAGSGGGGAAAGSQSVIAEGTPVSAGATLLTITDASSVSLSASVDETDVLLVTPGVPADVELDAVPGASYAAKVSAVDPAPTTSSRGGVSYQVRLTLDGGTTADGDPAPRPRAGMSAVADLRVRTARDAVSVPASAIVRDGNHDTVWAVEGGIVRRRVVKLGAQGQDEVQVRSGVQPGQRIVVRGADRVHEGQHLS